MEKYYHTIQDYHRFLDSVIDLVEDYIKYSNEIDENDGIYVDEDDNVSIMSRQETPDEADWYRIMIYWIKTKTHQRVALRMA